MHTSAGTRCAGTVKRLSRGTGNKVGRDILNGTLALTIIIIKQNSRKFYNILISHVVYGRMLFDTRPKLRDLMNSIFAVVRTRNTYAISNAYTFIYFTFFLTKHLCFALYFNAVHTFSCLSNFQDYIILIRDTTM